MDGSRPRKFPAASVEAILRAAQKDASFLAHITSTVGDVIQKIFGSGYWVQTHSYISTLCELLYYALTTLSLRQTLGEEYTGILQVNRLQAALPSKKARIFFALLQCFGPLALKLLLARARASLNAGSLREYLRPELREEFVSRLSLAQRLLIALQQTHLALFYINGSYLHLAKRVSGIRYVLVRKLLENHSSSQPLRLLGYLLLLQVAVSLLQSLHGGTALAREEGDELKDVSPSSPQCPLCLSVRENPSLSTCGHIFCWGCLHTAIATNGPHCPVCRYSVEASQVVPLYNAT